MATETTEAPAKTAARTNGAKGKKDAKTITIPRPNFGTAQFHIRGIAPLVMHKFSIKMREQLRATQEAGSVAKKGRKRDPKDFEACYEQARHISSEGWDGIPCAMFRNGMISACRTVGFQMTRAKLALFVVADGHETDGTALVKITKGEPFQHEAYVRNQTGVVDIRARPMWNPGWEAMVSVRFDADMFTTEDIGNLLARVGLQTGLGEGRPDSKSSAGMGWGLFELVEGD